MVGLAFPISAILIMHLVDWSCCFMTPGSIFIFNDGKFLLILLAIFGLALIVGLVAAHGLVTTDMNTDRTEVSGWFAM
mgnify:FL=1